MATCFQSCDQRFPLSAIRAGGRTNYGLLAERNTCYDRCFGNNPVVARDFEAGVGRVQIREQGLPSVLAGSASPQFYALIKRIEQVRAEKLRPAWTGVLGQVLGGFAQAAFSIFPGGAIAFGIADTLATQVERSQQGMAINIGGLLHNIGGIFGGSNIPALQGIGSALQIGGTVASAFAPQPTMIAGPVFNPPPQPPPSPVAMPVMAGAPMIAAGAGAIARVTAPILMKMAAKLGMRRVPSLSHAISVVRKAGKLLASPEAIAVALGITTAELATLIVSSNARKRRSMNPANAKALRRAARRIKGFHRLCQVTDLLKSRRRPMVSCKK